MNEKIYVAGPYTDEDDEIVEKNVVKAITVADQLSLLGLKPFIPHILHFWGEEYEHGYEFWMEQGSEWLSVCDGIYRIPGESAGSEREIEQAVEEGTPVFYNIAEVLLSFRGTLDKALDHTVGKSRYEERNKRLNNQ